MRLNCRPTSGEQLQHEEEEDLLCPWAPDRPGTGPRARYWAPSGCPTQWEAVSYTHLRAHETSAHH
eukprot:6381476-Alexandrium_andersonii.AAC.1